MAKKKIIAGFFSMLMFIFFINNLPEVSLPKGNGQRAAREVQNTVARVSGRISSLSKQTQLKTHIKVRYMGSECKFQPVLSFQLHRATDYVPCAVIIRNSSLVSAESQFRLKLRGPPSFLSHPA